MSGDDHFIRPDNDTPTKALCIKRIPCDPWRLEDKVCSVCQLAYEQEQNTKINYRAWTDTMMDFIRFKGLEHEFTDWSGGWTYPDHRARKART